MRLILYILVEGRTESTTVILLPHLLRSSVFTSSREDYQLFSAIVLLLSLSLRDCGTLPGFAGSAHRCCILHPCIVLGQTLLSLAVGDGETQLSA